MLLTRSCLLFAVNVMLNLSNEKYMHNSHSPSVNVASLLSRVSNIYARLILWFGKQKEQMETQKYLQMLSQSVKRLITSLKIFCQIEDQATSSLWGKLRSLRYSSPVIQPHRYA